MTIQDETRFDGIAPPSPRLRVPVTVRVSPDAAGDLPNGDVRAAVTEAVAAACTRFPLSALGVRLDDVTSVRVDVRPSGAGPDVPESLLEAAANGAREGAARAGFRSGPRRPGRTRVTGPAGEPFDPARVRHRANGTTYVVPFFDGETIEVPVRDADGPSRSGRHMPSVPGPKVALTVEEAVNLAWRWHLYRRGRPAFDRELPGYHGFIRTTSGAFLRYLFLTRVDRIGPDGNPLPGHYSYRMVLDTESVQDQGRGVQSFTFNAILYDGGPGGATYSLPTSGNPEGTYAMGGVEIPIVFARQEIERGRAAPGAAFPGYTALDGETGKPDDSELDPPPPPDDEPSALPVREPPRSPAGTQAALPGDPFAPPVTMVCAPYLVEPQVSALNDAGNLSGRIRSLAAVLSIDECAYAGTFALHCAAAIAGRARGVAWANITSATTTDVTVHPDGTGNNGFVHVKPTPTPELIWLQRLAGIAREVGNFAADVVATYMAPGNSRLVSPFAGADADAAGWVIRFIGDFDAALRLGYETVFAETCRAIMLQQLRSSYTGITARQEQKNFDALVEDIGTKLEILGDVVLWPTVLLNAISHAKDVYMSEGTVREILSMQEVISAGEGDVTYLPAPIDSTPQRVLAIVGGDRIERRGGERVAVHEGRAWTADELRETINQRRRLLNMSDPIFYQVPDLQRIVFGREQDRGFLVSYLRDLLKEMQAANEKMTRKSSDIDDGAYFALEASQYVKREGGRDWRGLRYTLQGIHQLADDLLVSEVAGDYSYTAGVNQAIDHKADKDELIAIASSFGIIVLSLLCAPLGAVAAGAITAVASIAFAVHDVLDARRQTDLYTALEDPELFEHWQDVQLAQMMAAVSVAFAVFDAFAVGKAAHALTTAARDTLLVAEKAGVRTAFRLAAQEIREGVLRGLTEEVLKRAVAQAVAEATVVAVMNEVLPHVVMPVLAPWIRKQAQEHGTLAEVDDALGPLAGPGGTP